MNNMVSMGKRIFKLRQERGMNQTQLAKAAGISRSYLSWMEKGKHKRPSANGVASIASALGTTIAYLMEEPVLGTPIDHATLPEPLRELIETKAESLDIRDEDVMMLARIRYRGVPLRHADDYECILHTLRMITRLG